MKVIILLIIMAACDSTSSSSVEKAFIENEIVSDVLKVSPKNIVNVSYPSGFSVDLGKELTPTQVKDKPQVTWQANKGAYYTLMMVDPDAPSRTDPKFREIRHWLVMNILESAVESGDEITEYRGSGAPKGTGLHRYIFLVYKQPNGKIEHTEPHTSNRSRAHRVNTSASALAMKYDLGDPELGNFFIAQYDEYVDVLQTLTSE